MGGDGLAVHNLGPFPLFFLKPNVEGHRIIAANPGTPTGRIRDQTPVAFLVLFRNAEIIQPFLVRLAGPLQCFHRVCGVKRQGGRGVSSGGFKKALRASLLDLIRQLIKLRCASTGRISIFSQQSRNARRIRAHLGIAGGSSRRESRECPSLDVQSTPHRAGHVHPACP